MDPIPDLVTCGWGNGAHPSQITPTHVPIQRGHTAMEYAKTDAIVSALRAGDKVMLAVEGVARKFDTHRGIEARE